MENIPYKFVVKSLMYAQTCMSLDISFVVGMFGRQKSNCRNNWFQNGVEWSLNSIRCKQTNYQARSSKARIYKHI